jgi:hypothetical protein
MSNKNHRLDMTALARVKTNKYEIKYMKKTQKKM